MQALASSLSESYKCRIIDAARRSVCGSLFNYPIIHGVRHSVLSWLKKAKADELRKKKKKRWAIYIYPIKKESFFQGMHFYNRGQLSFETAAQRILDSFFLEIF